MKSQITRALLGFVMGLIVALSACKPKDADIEKSIAGAISAYPGVSVTVNDGTATLTGEVADESTRSAVETAAKSVKGVKSVNNQLTVPPPPPPPVTINPDATLQQSVSTIITDMKLSKVNAAVSDGVITLTGEIKRAELPGLIQKLNEIKPKKIENKLVIK